jgi:hypothetical protein
MSTRCHVEIFASNRARLPIRLYRHSDGYPSCMVPAIANFCKEFIPNRGYDEEYLAAQLLYSMVKESLADMERCYATSYYRRHPKEVNAARNTERFLGFGICDSRHRHSDVDYIYQIRPSGVKVLQYKITQFGKNNFVTVSTPTETKQILAGNVPTRLVEEFP